MSWDIWAAVFTCEVWHFSDENSQTVFKLWLMKGGNVIGQDCHSLQPHRWSRWAWHSDVNLNNFRLHIRGGGVPTFSWFFLSVETSWHRRFHHEVRFIYLHVFYVIFIMFISAVRDLYWWTQRWIFFSTCYCPIYSGRNRSWSWEGGAHRCKKRQKK